jgi:hypothetical protein
MAKSRAVMKAVATKVVRQCDSKAKVPFQRRLHRWRTIAKRDVHPKGELNSEGLQARPNLLS